MEAKYGIHVLYFDTRLSKDYLDDALSIAQSIDRSVRRPDWLEAREPVTPDPVMLAAINRERLPASMDFSR